jgi:transposase-like protein
LSASKFSAEARAEIVESVAAGCSLPDAARAAGVGLDTLKRWLGRGRREDLGPYAAFEAAVSEARKEAALLSPGEMSVAEFREHLERSVRAGSVSAMKLWAEQFMIPPEELGTKVPVSMIARLAQRTTDGAA